jgi:hypothetical protein
MFGITFSFSPDLGRKLIQGSPPVQATENGVSGLVLNSDSPPGTGGVARSAGVVAYSKESQNCFKSSVGEFRCGFMCR